MAFAVSLAVAVLAAVMWAIPVGATHGSWTRHHLVVGEDGPSNYYSYGDLDAQSNPYDFGHIQWQRWNGAFTVLIEAESLTCWSSCTYRKTPTKYFPQTSYVLRVIECAKKGSHILSGVAAAYPPCDAQGTYSHVHTANVS